jgi:sugar lactone lactonase YvrE
VAKPEVRCVADVRNIVGESPVWDHRTQHLYWVDIRGKRLFRHDPATGANDSWSLPEYTGCIGLRKGACLVGALVSGLHDIRFVDGEVVLTMIRPVGPFAADVRFNDGRPDRAGRFVTGTMLDPTDGGDSGTLMRFTPDGGAETVLTGLIVQNGLAWSPDGRTMYLSDSHVSVQTIWTFDYDPDEGLPRNRRVFVDMHSLPGRPDGAAVDADGCYWTAATDAGLLIRLTPEAKVERKIELPVTKPSMCAFGGPSLETLYVTSIPPKDTSGEPLAGGVFALEPGVRGLAESEFAG